jgi:hypothetical protein
MWVKKYLVLIGFGAWVALAMGASGMVAIAAAENLSRSFTTTEDIVPGNFGQLKPQ